MAVLSFFLLLIGVFCFFGPYRYITLIVLAILSSSYFNLLPSYFYIGSQAIHHSDLALMLIFSLLPFRTKIKDTSLRGIEYSLGVFLVFLFIAVFYDLSYRHTTTFQVFRTLRKTGFLMFFFLMSSFSKQDYIKFFQFILGVTFFHSLLYISQYIFSYTLIDGKGLINELGEERYRSTPSYLLPSIALLLFLNKGKLKKNIVLFVFIVAVILSQGRGAIIAMLILFFLRIYFTSKIRITSMLFFGGMSICAYFIVSSFFPIIIERFSHLFTELSIFDKMDVNNLNSFYHEGSFIFRFGLTYERVVHVLKDPLQIIFGVGFIPDFDLKTPIFILGTSSPTLPVGYEQYNSVDIFFPNIITRYGIVGSILYLIFLVRIYIYSFSNVNTVYGKVFISYCLALGVISFVNETFYNGVTFFLIFAMLGAVYKPWNNFTKTRISK